MSVGYDPRIAALRAAAGLTLLEYRSLPEYPGTLPAVAGGVPLKILPQNVNRDELTLSNIGTGNIEVYDNPQGDRRFVIPPGSALTFNSRQGAPRNALWARGAAGHDLVGYEVIQVQTLTRPDT